MSNYLSLYVAKKTQLKWLNKFIPHLKGLVFDAGCGNKCYEKMFDRYIGMDINKGDFKGNICDIPLKKNSIDNVLCMEVLEHVLNPQRALHELYRILRPNGGIYLTVPMYWYIHYAPCDYWRFTNYSLMILVQNAGFKINFMDRCGGLNYFIACRIGESLYWFFKSFLPQFMVNIIMRPVQWMLYLYSKLDKFNKYDSAGWIVWATK